MIWLWELARRFMQAAAATEAWLPFAQHLRRTLFLIHNPRSSTSPTVCIQALSEIKSIEPSSADELHQLTNDAMAHQAPTVHLSRINAKDANPHAKAV